MAKDNRIILSGVPLKDEDGNRVTHVAGMEDELARRATPGQLQRLYDAGAIIGDWSERPQSEMEGLQGQIDVLKEQLEAEQEAHTATSKATGTIITNLENQLATANTNLELAKGEGVTTLRRAEKAEGDIVERDTLIATRDATIADLKAQLEAAKTPPAKPTK